MLIRNRAPQEDKGRGDSAYSRGAPRGPTRGAAAHPESEATFTMIDTRRHEAAVAGPRLIVLGAVHGNETCGTHAIERLSAALAAGAVRLRAGTLTMVPVTNRLAFEHGRRNGDRNLNRGLAPTATPVENEDRIANELCPLLAAHDVLLDLHSFHAPGDPFALVGPEDNTGALEPFAKAALEEGLALRLGVARVVDGWLSTYAAGAALRGGRVAYGIGTTEYMRSTGGAAVTLECGQHDDPDAPAVAWRAIMNTLAFLGMIDAPVPAPAARMQGLRLSEVIDRAHPGDAFVRPWRSFDPVRSGEAIARRHDGTTLAAPFDGHVVFPNPGAEPGFEWFYLARPHRRLSRNDAADEATDRRA